MNYAVLASKLVFDYALLLFGTMKDEKSRDISIIKKKRNIVKTDTTHSESMIEINLIEPANTRKDAFPLAVPCAMNGMDLGNSELSNVSAIHGFAGTGFAVERRIAIPKLQIAMLAVGTRCVTPTFRLYDSTSLEEMWLPLPCWDNGCNRSVVTE